RRRPRRGPRGRPGGNHGRWVGVVARWSRRGSFRGAAAGDAVRGLGGVDRRRAPEGQVRRNAAAWVAGATVCVLQHVARSAGRDRWDRVPPVTGRGAGVAAVAALLAGALGCGEATIDVGPAA